MLDETTEIVEDELFADFYRLPELSRYQRRVFDAVVELTAGYRRPPTVREVGEAVGLRSSGTVHRHIENLIGLGWLERDPKSPRGITLAAAADKEMIVLKRLLDAADMMAENPTEETRAWYRYVRSIFAKTALLR